MFLLWEMTQSEYLSGLLEQETSEKSLVLRDFAVGVGQMFQIAYSMPAAAGPCRLLRPVGGDSA
jgi:hypothetical protein